MSEVPSTGGSAAAQAFRAQAEQQGPPAPTAPPVTPAPRTDGRAATRKRMGGRARVVRAGVQPVVGKMFDLSETGACILLDSMLPNKAACTVEVEVFQNGQRYVFSTPATAVYGIFSSGKGFKVGLQFGPRSPEASKTIAALLA